MTETFKLVDTCKVSTKAKDLVSGYIKKCQTLLPRNNVYYNIPPLIDRICLTFYFIRMKFNTKNHGKDLEFIQDNIDEKCGPYSAWSVCIYGDTVSVNDCNVFNLQFKWTKADIMSFGFITSTIEKSIRDWSMYSVGIYVARGSRRIIHDANGKSGVPLDYYPVENYDHGDIFMLSIDFKENLFTNVGNDMKTVY